MTAPTFRFVHLTDTHVIADGCWRPRIGDFEWDTEASLRQVVAAVRALDPVPAFAVLGGDLASPDVLHRDRVLDADEYAPSYTLLAEILAELPCPVHVLMGNHDHRAAFNRVLRRGRVADDARCYYSFDHLGHHFVALDSHEPGEQGGVLDAEQLGWLDDDLARHRGQPTVAFVHHHPWPLGLPFIDGMALRNGGALMAALRRHDRLRWLICGHVHLEQVVQHDGLTMLTTPSTCIQLSKLPEPRMLPGPPGFRIVDVEGDRLSTRVLYLEH